MGLLEDVKAEQKGKPGGGRRCQMCTLVDAEESPLGASDAGELAAALALRDVSASTIRDVLARRDVTVNLSVVSNHRRAHVPGWSAR